MRRYVFARPPLLKATGRTVASSVFHFTRYPFPAWRAALRCAPEKGRHRCPGLRGDGGKPHPARTWSLTVLWLLSIGDTCRI